MKPGSVTIVGEIVEVGKIEKVGTKGTTKLTIIIVSDKDKDYPNYYPVDFFKNRIDWAINFAPGDVVRVRGVINGRRWQPKDETKDVAYFLGITAFSIKYADEPEKTARDEDDEDDYEPKSSKKSSKRADLPEEDDDDDLPF